MPDPLSHAHDMLIVKRDSLPRLWWLFPWTTAIQLHKNAVALKAYADQADRCIEMQVKVIEDLHDDIIRGASVPDAKEVRS